MIISVQTPETPCTKNAGRDAHLLSIPEQDENRPSLQIPYINSTDIFRHVMSLADIHVHDQELDLLLIRLVFLLGHLLEFDFGQGRGLFGHSRTEHNDR